MPSRWNELEKWLEGQQLPKGFDLFRSPDWVENYVRNMMTKTLPAAAAALSGGSADITETKRFLIVTFPLGEAADLSRVRLLVREDRLRIIGMSGGKAETVILPKLILPQSCNAQYDGTVLKIKLRKRPARKRVHEADIHWI
ncbi:hypothetical protein [Paenibacillus mendelii]|uniref:SHSP domain-containing protein n=1 Tax=Paenibacillus mendelii TaxID=206163 RepID=A0ABV6J4T7_9BACL|nr:hypothetical protein [Paenibacillus mendelii]MCQ6560408.1 hypothetical protein [Paenibacillus mendelii]